MSKIVIDFGATWARFWVPFGSPFGSQKAPKINPIHVPEQWRPQEAPRRSQEAPRELPRGPKKPQEGLKRRQKLAQKPQRVPREPSRGTKSTHPQDPLTTKPPNQQNVKQSSQDQGGRRHWASALKIRPLPLEEGVGPCETTRGTFSYSLKLKNDRILRILSYFPKEKYLGGAPPLAPAPNVGNFRGSKMEPKTSQNRSKNR